MKRRDVLRLSAGSMASVPFLPRAWTDAAGSRRPNILFFFPDQHRFDWLGTTSDLAVRTPHLDALGQRGVRFTRAVCASPLCAPSRACLALGTEYDRCGVKNNSVDLPIPTDTFYARLRESGYHVAGCGKFDLHKASHTWGLEGKHLLPEWGFSDGIDNAGKYDAVESGEQEPKDPYMAFLHARGLAQMHAQDLRERGGYEGTFPTPLPEEAYCDNWIADNGLQLLARAPWDKPWFLMVNFTGPHNPMDVTQRMYDGYRGVEFPLPHGNDQYTPEIHINIRRNYSAMIENIDRWLGVYLDTLRQRGELDRTIVVYSSDHGEMLGDRNLWGKSKPFQPSVGVPLIVAGPGILPGMVNSFPISVMDCTATFLDYAELSIPKAMDSRSFRPILEGRKESIRNEVRSGLMSWRMVMDTRYKLIRGYGGNEAVLLYDLENDPLEMENLAGVKPDMVSSLSKRLT